jgi:adenine-specific DNA-methyltransferase
MPKKPDEPQVERIAAQSPDMREELRERLRTLVPEAFAEGKLDANKLKALLGENGDAGPERYSFSWAGKRDAIAMLQLPTRATLVPDRDNSINFDEAQHVFIEGENLEVLKVLYRSYFGRVKMIYIDPPYNTGNDFIYPDDFADPLDHYLRITGQKNGNGDYTTSLVDRNGRIHSAWLSMMYPRLSLARQFLRDDGVIFVSIDDREVHNLRMLMNEVFGPECFAAQIAVVNNLKMPNTAKWTFWHVTDPDREQSFVICLDDTLTLEAVRALKLKKDSLFICRDTALDDTLSANLALQCRLKVL